MITAFQRNAFQSNAFQIAALSTVDVGGDYSTRYSRRRFDRVKEELERERERQSDERIPALEIPVAPVAPPVIAEARQDIDLAKLFPESAEHLNREIASDVHRAAIQRAEAVELEKIALNKRRADDELALALLLA